MNFGKIIREHLKIDDLVTIPGLGAFVTEELSAEIDENTKTVRPPSQKIVFNEKIRNNDGVLVQLVAKELNISHFEALQEIEEIRDDITYSIDKVGEYNLQDLGKLIRNEQGEIAFESHEDNFLSGESYGLSEEKLTTEPTIKKESTKKKVELLSPIVAASKQEKQPNLKKIVEEKSAEAVSQKKDVKKETPPPVVPPKKSKKEIIPPVDPPEKKEKERKRSFGWLWFLLFLLLIAFLIWWFLLGEKNNQPEKQVASQKKENVDESVSTQPKDTTRIDSLELAKNQSQPVVVDENLPPLTQPNAEKYYIVNGSFKEIDNVMKHYNNMKKKGFTVQYLGVYNGFHIISVGEYETERKAVRAKNYLFDKYPYMSFWIYNTKMLQNKIKN